MIEIQEMTAADVADLAALERLCFSAPWSENSIAEELETGFSLWLTARLDGAFAGYVGAQLVPPEADMMNLAVVPELRRRGTAQALLQALQERLAARGIGSLTLEVRASNLPAQRLYTAAGFACIGRRPNYYLAPREDALILRKELDHADPCH